MKPLGVVWLTYVCFGCASPSTSPADTRVELSVTWVDPVPTVEGGDLVVKIGAGRVVTAAVEPSAQIGQVELRALDPDEVLGRLAHGPFRFYVDGAVAPVEGRRRVCVSALDDTKKTVEQCVYLIR